MEHFYLFYIVMEHFYLFENNFFFNKNYLVRKHFVLFLDYFLFFDRMDPIVFLPVEHFYLFLQ